MKALASALAMVLIGLFGVWLWFDAASMTTQDTAGVVVVSEVDSEAVSAVQVPGSEDVELDASAAEAVAALQAAEEQPGAVDEIDETVVAATISSLRGVFTSMRTSTQGLSEDLHAAADQIAADEASAKAAAEAERKAAEEAAAQPAPQPVQPAPQPVQPAPQPVQPAPNPGGPPGPCWEWDDDDGWEWDCDDDDDWDDWDEDDWMDEWEDYLEDLYDD